MKKHWEESVLQFWYSRNPIAFFLQIVSWPYVIFMALRSVFYRRYSRVEKLPVPVVVVGNLTVGGTGKTPLVVAIVKTLLGLGYRPGVITRGYGNTLKEQPYVCQMSDHAQRVGDEALLLASKLQCPIIIDANRLRAAKFAIDNLACDIIISDDGLQHLALSRDIEIIVIDALRQFGNGYCLPIGPLREPLSRLKTVDFIVSNGEPVFDGAVLMYYLASPLYKLSDPTQHLTLNQFYSQTVHAVAGIGNPDRFFQSLTQHGIDIIPHVFPDHYSYQESDLQFNDSHVIIMTEKDAVKCKDFATDSIWVLPVVATMDASFWQAFMEKLSQCTPSPRNADSGLSTF